MQEIHKLLLHMAMVTKELSDLRLVHFPKFIEHGQWTIDGRSYWYLCTSPVGPSLGDLWTSLPEASGRKCFSPFTSLHLGFEMLIALQELHDAG